jgi:hypothetical protein
VEVDVGFQTGAKGLDGHDDTGSRPLLIVASVSVTADLRSHPTTDDPVHQAGDLAVEAGVALES